MARLVKKFVTDIDLNKNYLRKASFENLDSHPDDNPKEGQVYYNTEDKCFYFYHRIPATTQEGQDTFEWCSFVKTRDLLNILQETIVAGEGVKIERISDTLRISADFKNTAFELEFEANDWSNGELHIPVYDKDSEDPIISDPEKSHKCGKSPVLTTVMEYVNEQYQCIDVGFSHDLNGNVTIYSSDPFAGYLQLNSPYQGAATVENDLTEVLQGTVPED